MPSGRPRQGWTIAGTASAGVLDVQQTVIGVAFKRHATAPPAKSIIVPYRSSQPVIRCLELSGMRLDIPLLGFPVCPPAGVVSAEVCSSSSGTHLWYWSV
jgi:hypothetical protein